MKKRNVLVTVLAMVLVAVVSVTGTLAYLTANDGKAVNTFQFANGIKVDLWEPQPEAVANEKIEGNQETGWNYTNLVPGQKVNKAPTFKVEATVPTYVFARVTNNASNVTIDDMPANGWQLVPGESNVYFKAADATQELGALFNTVTIGDVAIDGKPATQETYDLGSIEIEVAAIQQAGFASEVEALKAAVWQK